MGDILRKRKEKSTTKKKNTVQNTTKSHFENEVKYMVYGNVLIAILMSFHGNVSFPM